MKEIDFSKLNGLVPAVIQDPETRTVLMVGFMNQEALETTIKTGKVTFYSRSKGKLWTKGETSGNFLHVKEVIPDCDQDTLLVLASPDGPACHTGADTCFKETNEANALFLNYLEKVIEQRKQDAPEGSYTAELFSSGINKIAQKVGEEAVEAVIEGINGDQEALKNETADLLYHLLVLLNSREIQLSEIVQLLKKRHDPS